MKITKDVILDLLPAYSAGEVSDDTRKLVEAYLKTDPELAEIVKTSAEMKLTEDIPVPMKKEDQMEAYLETKRLMFRRTIILAAIISVSVLSLVSLVALMFFRSAG